MSGGESDILLLMALGCALASALSHYFTLRLKIVEEQVRLTGQVDHIKIRLDGIDDDLAYLKNHVGDICGEQKRTTALVQNLHGLVHGALLSIPAEDGDEGDCVDGGVPHLDGNHIPPGRDGAPMGSTPDLPRSSLPEPHIPADEAPKVWTAKAMAEKAVMVRNHKDGIIAFLDDYIKKNDKSGFGSSFWNLTTPNRKWKNLLQFIHNTSGPKGLGGVMIAKAIAHGGGDPDEVRAAMIEFWGDTFGIKDQDDQDEGGDGEK